MSDPILDYILKDRERLDLALKLAPAIQAAKKKILTDFWASVAAIVDASIPDDWTAYFDPDIWGRYAGFSLLPPGCQRNANTGTGTSAFYYYRIEPLRDYPWYGICRSSDKIINSMESSLIEKLKMDGFSQDSWWLGKRIYGQNITSRILHYEDASILDLFTELQAGPGDQNGLAHQVALPFVQLITKYLDDVVALNERMHARP